MELDEDLRVMAEIVLDRFRESGLRTATAESCTGGLVSALLTAIPGSSDVVDRGFVTYSNEAKAEMLGVARESLETHGAVSAPVAAEMARGAIEHSHADAAVSITGIAGPGGGSAEKPVGLVFIAVARRDAEGAFVEEFRFTDMNRDEIRTQSVRMAMEMLLAYGIDEDEVG